MKYVVTGSLGHISQPIVKALAEAGHEVTVITSTQNRVKDIEALGAKAALGSVEDQAFLNNTFSGAHTVYTMVPPKSGAPDWKAYIGQIGKNYAEAIKTNHVQYVVNLSSVGAHMADGCGPVSGLYRAEAALNSLKDTNIKHLRPAYFYYNLFSNIGLIKNMGIIGSNFGIGDKKFAIVDPADIAAAAIPLLLDHNFSGHSVEYIASDELSTDDIAAAIGKAINKPGLKWVSFTDEQALQGALQAGLPEEMAKNYAEMGHAIQTGEMYADYWKHRPAVLGKIKMPDFAKSFAAVYNSEAPVTAH